MPLTEVLVKRGHKATLAKRDHKATLEATLALSLASRVAQSSAATMTFVNAMHDWQIWPGVILFLKMTDRIDKRSRPTGWLGGLARTLVGKCFSTTASLMHADVPSMSMPTYHVSEAIAIHTASTKKAKYSSTTEELHAGLLRTTCVFHKGSPSL